MESTTDVRRPLRLAVIGGGIGGLSLLLGIIRHTDRTLIQPHLYESASTFSEIGAGVSFGPNAVRAMKCVDQELHQAYMDIAAKAPIIDVGGKPKIAWHHFHMGMNGRSKRCSLNTMDDVCGTFNDNQMQNVHRATFLNSMLGILAEYKRKQYVTFKKRLTDIGDNGEGKVVLRFADGSSDVVDAVIGCDGVKSRTRQILLSPLQPVEEFEPRFTGKYAYRGLIPMEDAVSVLGERARVNLLIVGYGGHLVTYPVDKGRTFNCVAFQSETSGIWPYKDQWVVPSSVEELLNDYLDWGEPIKDLLKLVRKPEKWGLFDHPPAKTFYKGSTICLLGDCAHASTPHQGAGAGMAIEDAAVLAHLLGQIKAPTSDQLEAVFSIYDQIRRPRDLRLVNTSREAGLLYDFEQPGIEDDVEKIREVLTYRYDWIWEHDNEREIADAIALVQQKIRDIPT